MQTQPPKTPKVERALCRIDERDRVVVPPGFFRGTAWKLDDGGDVLAVLEAIGCVRLLPWSPKGDEVLATQRELEARDDDDEDALDALQQLEHKFHRLTVEKPRRLKLSDYVLQHLQPNWPLPSQVFVLSYPDRVELWSPEFHGMRVRRLHPLLRWLP